MWNHLKPNMDNLISRPVPNSLPIGRRYRTLRIRSIRVSPPQTQLLRGSICTGRCGDEFPHHPYQEPEEANFTILNFVNGIVGKYETAPDDQKNPREKEGA
jgi:hypothetical protein